MKALFYLVILSHQLCARVGEPYADFVKRNGLPQRTEPIREFGIVSYYHEKDGINITVITVNEVIAGEVYTSLEKEQADAIVENQKNGRFKRVVSQPFFTAWQTKSLSGTLERQGFE